MAIYAISDLHLSFGEDKPMDIFGDNWENHAEKIKEDWLNKVTEEDTILLPGDFSWAMKLEDTKKDFEYLVNLPGKKILLKGNHDYWWTTLAKMKEFLDKNHFGDIYFLYNNSYLVEETIIAGTRGWALNDTENSCKILKRENARLKLSIDEGIQKYGNDKEIIICMHYPPICKDNLKTGYIKSEFIEMMKQYKVKKCFYGHLHGSSHKDAVEGIIDGIDFQLISCDYTNFKLIKVKE